MSYDGISIQDTHTTMNPAHPETAEFYDRDQVAYVLKRESGRLLVATSFGPLDQLETGRAYGFHHDQSGRFIGNLLVVGTADFSTGETTGEVPDRAIRHFVFK